MDREQKRNWLRIVFGLLCFLCGWLFRGRWPQIAAWLLSWAVCGYPVLWNALKELFSLRLLDENFLMSVASVGAIALGQTAEGAAVMLLYAIGEALQELAEHRTRSAIDEMLKLHPDTVTLIRNGVETRITPEEASVGDLMLIKSGERVGLDGVIEKGRAELDTSALTGESLPQYVKEGDIVRGGCICANGMLTARVTSVYADSTVAKILSLMKEGANRQTRSERFMTRFARVYTPAVCLSALLLFLIPVIFLNGNVRDWGYRALSFLVVSCPCALVISIPLAYFCGIGAAGKRGILVRGADVLEALSHTGIMVFDKTGTLTRGSFTVAHVHPSGISKDKLLEMAAAVESVSNHPISRSVCAYTGLSINPNELSEVREIPGRGVSALWYGKRVSAGNEEFMREEGVALPEFVHGETVVHIAADGVYQGHLVLADEIKPETKSVLSRLRQLGIRWMVMLTGDHEYIAREVAYQLGMDVFYPRLLPDDKIDKVCDMLTVRRKGETLTFVGDGMNDAPVLSFADVGIAMGAKGSDAAIRAAGIVLMDDHLTSICDALLVAKKTRCITKENIFICLIVKLVLIVLSALGITPLWLSVVGDVGVCLLTIANAARALHLNSARMDSTF